MGAVTREQNGWVIYKIQNATIWVPGIGNLAIEEKGKGSSFAWIKSGKTIYVSKLLRKAPYPRKPDSRRSPGRTGGYNTGVRGKKITQ